MPAMDFYAMAQECAPLVHPQTLAAVVRVESGFNPFAIGVVGGRLERQPQNKAEAVATAKALAQAGWNFSLGAGQVNRYNLARFGLDFDSAFDPCSNLRVGSNILHECFTRAKTRYADDQAALHAAFSCYYSGNFVTGFKPDFKGQPSYVQKVLNSAASVKPIAVVPAGATAPRAAAVKSQTVQAVQLDPGQGQAQAPVLLQAARQTRQQNIPARLDGFAPRSPADEDPYDGFSTASQAE